MKRLFGLILFLSAFALNAQVILTPGGGAPQQLGLTGNTLSISGGNSVSLAGYLDNTDSQTLGLVGSTLSITGGNSVDLSGLGGGATNLLGLTDVSAVTHTAGNLLISNGTTAELRAPTTTDFDNVINDLGLATNNTGSTGNILMLGSDVTGVLTWATPAIAKANIGFMTDLSDDASPSLSANLDTNNFDILNSAGNVIVDDNLTVTGTLTAQMSQMTNPADTGTGTVIDMSGYHQYNMSAASSATTYTVSGTVAGGYAECLINSATPPSVTGATQLPDTQAFISNTDMIMHVKAFGSTIKYWFTQF